LVLVVCVFSGVLIGVAVMQAVALKKFTNLEARRENTVPVALDELKTAAREEVRTALLPLGDIHTMAQQIKRDHDQTQNTFEDWMGTANGVLSEAAKGSLREMWLSHPWEYMALLEKADAELRADRDQPERHIESVALYGTMVGFAFLLPEALRNHACRAKEQLQQFSIHASDATIVIDNQDKALVHYPLWLVGQLVLELTQTCQSFKALLARKKPHRLSIVVAYLPHDILHACIHLPPREIAVLQALDIKGLQRILNGQELQVGFRHINSEEKVEAYDRFAAAMTNIDRTHRRKKERWTITGDGSGNQKIIVDDPHWNYDSAQKVATLIVSSEDYDKTATPQIVLTGGVGIRDCIEALLEAITAAGSSGNDVRALRELVNKKKEIWQRRHRMTCPCNETSPTVIVNPPPVAVPPPAI